MLVRDYAKKVVNSKFIKLLTKDEGKFVEEEHPRGHEGNPGQFVKKGTGKSTSSSKGKEKEKPVAKKAAPSKTDMQTAKFDNGKLIAENGKSIPEHIAKLKIPPAWTNIVYNENPKAELLIKGKDIKGRAQYIYSEDHWNKAAASKFARIKELNRKFESIEQQNESNLQKKKMEEALVMKLIMQTGCRPGSDDDTQAKVKAYGASTLEGRHVTIEDGKVYLNFIGKKGVQNNIPVMNLELAKELIARSKKVKPDEKIFNTDRNALSDYSHSLDGGGFKTKDFRTLLGTRTAMQEIENLSPPVPKDVKEYKKKVKEVAIRVSKKLGNTPTVALQSYINPSVFAEWKLNAGA